MSEVFVYEHGRGSVAVVYPVEGVAPAAAVAASVPDGKNYLAVPAGSLPTEDLFRNAWAIDNGKVIVELSKAKLIAHDYRRQKRAEEFAPLDEVITKQIPGHDHTEVESKRQQVRDRYADMQAAIDAATSPEELKGLLGL